MKEAVQEYLQSIRFHESDPFPNAEPFLSRKDMANRLGISLVTLTDWVKRGLPSHKQRGRVNFLYSEVQTYLTLHPLARFRFVDRFEPQP